MKALTPNEKKAQQIIVGEVEKAMDLLQAHFQKYCDEVAPMYNGGQKVTNVPMAYIDQSIKIIKENYRKGAKEK